MHMCLHMPCFLREGLLVAWVSLIRLGWLCRCVSIYVVCVHMYVYTHIHICMCIYVYSTHIEGVKCTWCMWKCTPCTCEGTIIYLCVSSSSLFTLGFETESLVEPGVDWFGLTAGQAAPRILLSPYDSLALVLRAGSAVPSSFHGLWRPGVHARLAGTVLSYHPSSKMQVLKI